MDDGKLVLIGLVLVLVLLLGTIGWRMAYVTYVIKDPGETRGGLKVLEQPGRTISPQDSDIYREEERVKTGVGGSGGGGSSGSSGTESGDSDSDEDEEKTLKTFEVLIQSERKVYAVDIKLNFDKNKVEIVSITEGNFLKQDGAGTYPIISWNNSEGKINFASTRFGTQEGISGGGIFAIIKFKALTSGTSEINFEEITLVDSNLNKLDFQFVDGKIIAV